MAKIAFFNGDIITVNPKNEVAQGILIERGKYADLVILDKNPLKVKVDKIKNIQMLETIKQGEVVFKK